MRHALRLAFLAALVASMAGCRFKGYESFASSTTSRPELHQYPTKQGGDPYGDDGVADPTGGLDPQTRYGLGAQAKGTVRPGYDQPQKGSGQQNGEYPNVASAGHAQTNAPSFQPSPSDVGQPR